MFEDSKVLVSGFVDSAMKEATTDGNGPIPADLRSQLMEEA